VKGGTLLADKMDWLLDHVHNFGKFGTSVPSHAPAKAGGYLLWSTERLKVKITCSFDRFTD